eukprot:EG_transcript_21296
MRNDSPRIPPPAASVFVPSVNAAASSSSSSSSSLAAAQTPKPPTPAPHVSEFTLSLLQRLQDCEDAQRERRVQEQRAVYFRGRNERQAATIQARSILEQRTAKSGAAVDPRQVAVVAAQLMRKKAAQEAARPPQSAPPARRAAQPGGAGAWPAQRPTAPVHPPFRGPPSASPNTASLCRHDSLLPSPQPHSLVSP